MFPSLPPYPLGLRTFAGSQGQGKLDTRVLELAVCVCSQQEQPDAGADSLGPPGPPGRPELAGPGQDASHSRGDLAGAQPGERTSPLPCFPRARDEATAGGAGRGHRWPGRGAVTCTSARLRPPRPLPAALPPACLQAPPSLGPAPSVGAGALRAGWARRRAAVVATQRPLLQGVSRRTAWGVWAAWRTD